MICAAALAGLPLTSGFVSKELILTQMNLWAGTGFSWRWLILLGAWMVTFLTPFYTLRMVWFIFFRKSNHETDIVEVPFVMRIPMLFLALGSFALIITFDPFHISSFINVLMPPYPDTNHIIALLSLMMVALALVAGYMVFKKDKLPGPNKFLSPHFYLDWVNGFTFNLANQLSDFAHQIDRKVIDKIIHGLTYLQITMAHITGWSDRYLVDGLVNGAAYSAKGIGLLTRSLANGKIQSYLLWALAGLLIFILWILY
jgi:NADH-quinone oxidoreductase subunit L